MGVDGERNEALGQWMADHLRVAWLPHPEPWTVEAELIALPDNRNHSPPPLKTCLKVVTLVSTPFQRKRPRPAPNQPTGCY